MVENSTISSYQGLVYHIAKSFNPPNDIDLQEYVSEGNIGLLKALRKYDIKRGKLSTFAWKYIVRAITKYVNLQNKNISTLSIPSSTSTSIPLLWEILPDNLNDIETEIITKRWNGYTFAEIGEMFGYKRSWAKQKFDSIIKKIQKANADK
jgi:RNA polymerase sigma factor (sigma-70 family)